MFAQCIYVLLILLAICTSIAVDNGYAQDFHLVGPDDFAPYSWKDDEGLHGMDLDFIHAACRRAELRCQIRLVPWKRALRELAEGTVDCVFSGYRTPERDKIAIYGDTPVHYTSYRLFVPKGHEARFQQLEHLHGSRISLNSGFKLGGEFQAMIDKGAIVPLEVPTVVQGVRLTLANHADGFVTTPACMARCLEQLDMPDALVPAGPVLAEQPAYLMFPRRGWDQRRAEHARRIGAATRCMHRDGSAQRIRAGYID